MGQLREVDQAYTPVLQKKTGRRQNIPTGLAVGKRDDYAAKEVYLYQAPCTTYEKYLSHSQSRVHCATSYSSASSIQARPH